MRPGDQLDLVELNECFVQTLRHRFQTDPAFQPAARLARVLHCPVEDLPPQSNYDLIVSGLPLNNFSVAQVERILGVLIGLLKPGGTLSFFEYVAVRRARSLVSRRAERARLRGIGEAMAAVLRQHEIDRDRSGRISRRRGCITCDGRLQPSVTAPCHGIKLTCPGCQVSLYFLKLF